MFGFLKSAKTSAPQMVVPDRTSTPFDKLTPLAFEDGIFSCSDGNEHYLGACFVGEPLAGADGSTVDKLRSALGMPLPPGSFIQIAQLASPDVDDFFKFYKNKKATADAVPFELANRHVEHFRNGVDVPLVERSGVLLHRKRLIVTVKFRSRSPRPSAGEIKSARELADRLQEGLKAAGLPLRDIGPEDYLGLMRLLQRLWEPVDSTYDEGTPLQEQIYFPGDAIEYDRDEITFNGGSHYAKALSVKYFPRRASLAIMNYMIGEPLGTANQLTEPYYMVLTLHYPDQVAKADWVRSRSAMINHQVFGPTAHMIPVLGYKKAGIDTLVHEMEGRGAVLCETNFTIFVFSKSKDKVKKAVAGLQPYFASLAFEMREDSRILEPLWTNLLPLNTTLEGIKNLFRFHTMAISHAVQFLPIIGEWTGTGNSGSVMMVTRRGQPALFDLYESSTNYNSVVFAESGGGKSFLTQEILSAYLAEGAKIWVIDAGRSYYKLARSVGGSFVEFSNESQICLNPFTFIDGNLDDEMDILKAMLAKMAAPEEKLDDYRMSLLEQAITAVYTKYGNNATISAVAQYCIQQADPEAQRLGKQLFPFAGGSYTRWFDGENNLDMDNAFMVLELQELKGRKALQQVVLLQLMSRINHEMFLTHGRKKILVIDEAWEMLDDPVMGKAMEAVYRKARKHAGAVMVVTQSVADLYNSPNARAIYENSAWQFILQQKAESIDAAISGGQFKIEPYGAKMLRTVHTVKGRYSEVMVKRSGDNWGILRLVVPRFKQILYSTSGDERDVILADLDRGEDVITSINRFMEHEQRERH